MAVADGIRTITARQRGPPRAQRLPQAPHEPAEVLGGPRPQRERRFAAIQPIDRDDRHFAELQAGQLRLDAHLERDRPADRAGLQVEAARTAPA